MILFRIRRALPYILLAAACGYVIGIAFGISPWAVAAVQAGIVGTLQACTIWRERHDDLARAPRLEPPRRRVQGARARHALPVRQILRRPPVERPCGRSHLWRPHFATSSQGEPLMQNNCIFDPSTNRVIDIIPAGDDGKTWFAVHGDEYGDNLIVLPIEEGAKRYEDSFKTAPKEIAAEDWTYALEVLPPLGWRHVNGGEIFKMSERTAGAVTSIYVRIGERYFQFADDIRTPPEACVDRVKKAFSF